MHVSPLAKPATRSDKAENVPIASRMFRPDACVGTRMLDFQSALNPTCGVGTRSRPSVGNRHRGERTPGPLCYHAGVEKLIYRDGLPAYKIFPMREDHLAEIEAIEKKSFPYPWSRGIFEAEVRNVSGFSHPFVLAANDGRVAGYLCTWNISNEYYVNNIAVAPELRGRGL